ncbi:MAG: dihydrofolate reductase [Clostridia bacterium]|nr:dihydrofolate reductase [Clostridia bacterium]
MKMIVCVSEDFGIGYKGDLLFSLPPDMKFFREKTKEKAVIMGRGTLDSFPGGKPLKNRVNIVLTRDKNFAREGALVFNSKEEILEYIKNFPEDDVFVIGGGQIYEMFKDDCSEALVTKVRKKVPCDTFFFNVDKDEKWALSDESELFEHEGTQFSFCTYRKI